MSNYKLTDHQFETSEIYQMIDTLLEKPCTFNEFQAIVTFQEMKALISQKLS